MTESDGDGFLNRWSARKRAAVRDEATPEDGPVDPLQDVSAAETTKKSDGELLAELDLPDPDALVKGDDFSKFMTSAVPARLRNRALRRLWVTDPVLANLDELLDYGDDFTDAATVVENMKTVYDSVRGMLPEEVEQDEPMNAAEDAPDISARVGITAEEGGADDADPVDLAEEYTEPDLDVDPARGVEVASNRGVEALEVDALPPPRTQRMRFRFDTT